MEVEVREGRRLTEYFEVHVGRYSFVNEGGVAKHDEGGRIEHALKYFTEYRVYRGDRLLRTLYGAGGFNKNFVYLWLGMLFGRVVRGTTTYRPILEAVNYADGWVNYSPYGLMFASKAVIFYPMVPLVEYKEDTGEFSMVESGASVNLLYSLFLGPLGYVDCSRREDAGRFGIVLGGPFYDGTRYNIIPFGVGKVTLTSYQLCQNDSAYQFGSPPPQVGTQVLALDYRKYVFGGIDVGDGVGTLYFRRRAEHVFALTNIICESGLHGYVWRAGNIPTENALGPEVVMFANDVITTDVGGCIQLASGEALEVISYLRVVST